MLYVICYRYIDIYIDISIYLYLYITHMYNIYNIYYLNMLFNLVLFVNK